MTISFQQQTEIQTEIYNDFESLESIQSQWDEFVQKTGNEIFMSYDWQRIWWKYYGKGRRLNILIYRHNDRIVGIIPLFLEIVKIGPLKIKCIKIVGSDFSICPVTVPVQTEFLELVLSNFNLYLQKCSDWDVIHIGPLSGICKDYHRFNDICKNYLNENYNFRTSNHNVQTFYFLNDDEGEAIQFISKRQKGTIKHKYNNLKKMVGNKKVQIDINFVEANNFEKMFNEFTCLHRKQWQNRGMAGHFKDWPNGLEFHRDLAFANLKKGRLWLMEIRAAEQLLGYKYSYKFGNNLVDFLDARIEGESYSNAGLGNIILYEFLKKAQNEQVQYIDSLKGRYEHKLRMGGKLLSINNIFISHNSYKCCLKLLLCKLFAKLINLIYYRIWFSRIASKLHLNRKPLWQIWIKTSAFANSICHFIMANEGCF